MNPEHEKFILKNIGKKSLKEISDKTGISENKIKKFLKEKDVSCGKTESPRPEPRKSPKDLKKVFISLVAIAALGVAAYWGSLGGGYVWDDEYLVQNNLYIKNSTQENVARIFTEDFGAGGGKKYGYYRPLQIFSYMINYKFSQLDLRWYHLTNVVLHVLAAMALYWFICVLYGDMLLAFFVSMLFVVHPVQVEAVDYISGRGDPLGVLFLFLAFISYIKIQDRFDFKYFAIMLVSFSLSLFTKEGSIILIGLVVVYHAAFKKRIDWKYFLLLVGCVVFYSVIRAMIAPSVVLGVPPLNNLLMRVPGFFVAIPEYIRLLFAPFNLHMEYGEGPFFFGEPRAIFGILAVATLVLIAFSRWGKDKVVFFSIAWFFTALLPVSNIYPVAFFMSEHYLYLPSIGFFILISVVLAWACRTKNLKIPGVILFTAIIAFYAFVTIKQHAYWKDNLTFYRMTEKHAPFSARIANDLGRIYDSMERYDEAVKYYKRTIELDPKYAFAYNNIGVIYNKQKRFDKALPFFRKAIELKQDYPDALNNIAVVYSALGQPGEALKAYQKAVELYPNFAGAYCNMGSLYTGMGKHDEALKMFEKALSIEPRLKNAYYNMAVTYRSLKELDKALDVLKRCEEIDPYDGSVQAFLADIYEQKKSHASAILHCDRAVSLGVKIPQAFLDALEPYRKK